ncbi:MAG: hypothetical protein R2712_23745 [Vicinamibacterales bacterium]
MLAKNGNTPAGVDVDWYETVKALAKAHSWGTADRFADFGMAPLGPTIAIKPSGGLDTVAGELKVPAMMRRVEASMAAGFRSRRIVRRRTQKTAPARRGPR